MQKTLTSPAAATGFLHSSRDSGGSSKDSCDTDDFVMVPAQFPGQLLRASSHVCQVHPISAMGRQHGRALCLLRVSRGPCPKLVPKPCPGPTAAAASIQVAIAPNTAVSNPGLPPPGLLLAHSPHSANCSLAGGVAFLTLGLCSQPLEALGCLPGICSSVLRHWLHCPVAAGVAGSKRGFEQTRKEVFGQPLLGQ